MQVTLKVTGVSGAVRNLYAADAEINTALRRVNREAMRDTAALVRQWCPVDTTFMVRHVREDLTRDELKFRVGWDAADFTAAGLPFYPPYVEYGTINSPAQPSLGPAWREMRPLYERDVRDAVRAAIARRAMAGHGRRGG